MHNTACPSNPVTLRSRGYTPNPQPCIAELQILTTAPNPYVMSVWQTAVVCLWVLTLVVLGPSTTKPRRRCVSPRALGTSCLESGCLAQPDRLDPRGKPPRTFFSGKSWDRPARTWSCLPASGGLSGQIVLGRDLGATK